MLGVDQGESASELHGQSYAPEQAPLAVAEAQHLWEPSNPYLNTASYGLPPRPGWKALQAALADWRGGRTSWEHWGESTEAARAAFARLTGVAVNRVTVGATVSELVGLVAAAVPDGTRVVAPDVEFTSLLFPWMVHADRGLEVVTVPLHRLAETIDARTGVVALSAVQSATGELADLDAVLATCRHHGALTVVDATQACGWLPLDSSRFDAVVCGAYKWLMSPRGTAFMSVSDELLERLKPLHAGWYAGENPHASYYGPPLRLAASARRLDTSPAWFSWVGTQPALELIERIGIETICEHDLSLANRFRAGLGLEPYASAIVSTEVPGAERRLEQAGIRASVRGGRLRTSFHVYNTQADVDAVLDALLG